ncbi:MAG: hypothetical protein JO235_23990 [Chroococcidiopsidaceae cyanobacterium CP_BM_RX_35]|nr:hypothetical protein [Chroococcidiopsidaceae cyanobacterium CP_BM_RX_35]
MNLLTETLLTLKTWVLTAFLTSLLFSISAEFSNWSSAQTFRDLNPGNDFSTPLLALTDESLDRSVAPASQQILPSSNGFSLAAANFVREKQLSFEEATQTVTRAITDLPVVLQSAIEESDSSNRDLIEKQLNARSELLESAADSVDDLAESLQKVSKKLSRSVNTTELTNISTVQQALEDAAQSIDLLATDTEKAKDKPSPALKTKIEQQLLTLQQTLDAANSAFRALASPG